MPQPPSRPTATASSASSNWAAVEGGLERIAPLHAKHAKAAGKRHGEEGAGDHLKAECALRDHPTIGAGCGRPRRAADRRPRQGQGRGTAGRQVPAVHQRPRPSVEDIALGYKNLLEAERAFRDLKTTLELRPVFHRLEHRIRAHVLLCWLALLLVRVANRQTGSTWRRINTELAGCTWLPWPARPAACSRPPPSPPAQQEVFAATSVAPPPRITSLQPA